MAQTEKSRDVKAANREHYEAKKLINTWRLSKNVKYLVVFVSNNLPVSAENCIFAA
jgi:hypothetical protein